MKANEKMIAKLQEMGLANEWKKGSMHRFYLDLSKVQDALDDMDDAAKRHVRLPLNRREMDNGKVWIDAETLEIETKYINLMMGDAARWSKSLKT